MNNTNEPDSRERSGIERVGGLREEKRDEMRKIKERKKGEEWREE